MWCKNRPCALSWRMAGWANIVLIRGRDYNWLSNGREVETQRMARRQPLNPDKPAWLRRRALSVEDWHHMKSMLDQLSLATICEEADCPNIGECFRSRTATFLIMGRVCTRNCRFCAVQHGQPVALDADEPQHLVEAVQHLGLRHVVITSVTRDDLPDGGAAHLPHVLRRSIAYADDRGGSGARFWRR